MKISVEEFLQQNLGIKKHVLSNKGWYRACCPIHGEQRPSFGVLTVYPYVAKCFSCGFKGSLAWLTTKLLKVPLEKAIEFINETVEIKFDISRAMERGEIGLSIFLIP